MLDPSYPHTLFQQALGLLSPWIITEVVFSKEDGRLDLTVTIPAGSQFPCASCQASSRIYDHRERTWRHLNFFQYRTYLHASVPRTHCDSCKKTTTLTVPWARPGSGFTLLFEAFVMEIARALPLLEVERITGEYDTRIMRVVEHYVTKARESVDMSGVRTTGIDETSCAKGHTYVTTIADLDEDRILYATPGKDSATIARFSEDFQAHGGDPAQITDAVIDLSPAFIKGVEEYLPNAEITFDRFHTAKIVNTALDAVRRAEQQTMPTLQKTRYMWLRNPTNITTQQQEHIASISTRHCKTARAYQMKLAFNDVFTIRDRADAERALHRWYYWATHSRILQMIDAAKTIKRHWDGVLGYFDRRLSNGKVEGMNSVIQIIKRRARGFPNTNNFITMIYLVCGKLPIRLPSLMPMCVSSHHG